MKTDGDVLQTARTCLLPFAAREAEALLHLFRHPEVRAHLLDDVIVTPAWMRREIEASEDRFARIGIGMWSVWLEDDEDLVGFAGFREVVHPPQPNLLYGLLPDYWGRGLALEVTSQVCDHALRQRRFAAISATTDITNPASARVLRRLGMKMVATDDGDGTASYALDRGAWLAREAAN